ncbi:hypothetical protein WMY93_026309 [Mugilogobius chulae]|uniref:Protoporphyrinogen oxidase n=1 Tax=Mugilogobius chulae TaxID=88201 RepID=A0AAW0N1K9_9GOBI
MRTVAVLGGGIGGLAAAHYLSRSAQPTKVIVLEASSRFGGWLWSNRRSDGAVFELGPRGVRPVGPVGRNTLNLVEELGLQSEVIPVTYSHVASQNRFLFVKGRLWKMPSGLSGLLKTTPPFSRPLLPQLLREVFVSRGKEEDESLHAFVSRRFGAELADIAVDSLCRGVFAGDCRKLSVRACFPDLHRAEQSRGSVLLGMLLGSGGRADVAPGLLAQRAQRERWAQWSLLRGVQSLPEALVVRLKEQSVELLCETPVRRLEDTGTGWSGFGHLLPSSEDPGLLGVVYDSEFFPQHNSPDRESTRLTVMMGGAWFQQVFGDPDQVDLDLLLSKAVSAVSRQLGLSQSPVWSSVVLHRDCIPQYQQGTHTEAHAAVHQRLGLPLSLVGSSYDGVSVNDVIFSGRTAVDELLQEKK